MKKYSKRNKKYGKRNKKYARRKTKKIGGELFERKTYLENKAINIIGSFMNKNKHEIAKKTSKYLNSICSDSGVCIAFGQERRKILHFFEGFANFKYVKSPIETIGVPSENGFIKQFTYEKEGYISHAVLKSSIDKTSDNLWYEHLVGQFINRKCDYFSCFVETYGLYYYEDYDQDVSVFLKNIKSKYSKYCDSQNFIKFMQNNLTIDNRDAEFDLDDDVLLNLILSQQLEYDKFNKRMMCEKTENYAILIQHLKECVTLHSFCDQNINFNTFESNLQILSNNLNKLLAILYQVYFPLAILSSEFTHYDLHLFNILLYTPIHGKHIKYFYHVDETTIVTFYSEYIAKIIDYGRCFTSSSQIIYQELCDKYKTECETPNNQCESKPNHGFHFFDSSLTKEDFFISSRISNLSHDLKALNDIDDHYYSHSNILRTKIKDIEDELKVLTTREQNKRIELIELKKKLEEKMNKSENFKNPILTLLRKVKYGIGLSDKNQKFGTKPDSTSGLPSLISNVKDAQEAMKLLLLDPTNIEQNSSMYLEENKIGEIHIYADGRPMKYVSS